MSDPQVLRNFVGGEHVDPADGRHADLVDPSHRRGVRLRAGVLRRGRRPRLRASAADAFETLAGHHAVASGSGRCCDSPTCVEEHADELVAAGEPQHRQAAGADRARRRSRRWSTRSGSSPAPPACWRAGRPAEYMAGHTSWVRREPIGVVGQVTPWNYPMMMAVWKFAPAIAAGNTVVLKPSDTTPVTTLRLAELAAEFLPAGRAQRRLRRPRHRPRAGRAPDARRWSSITGSVRAGMEVAGAAARDLKRVHLELGGKAPVVVFDDADLEAAAEAIAVAGYFNAGQDCTAATRVLAAPGIHDDFVAALTEQAREHDHDLRERRRRRGRAGAAGEQRQPAGPGHRLPRPRCPATPRSPPAARRQGDRGFFVEPTVVAGLRQDDEIVQQRGLRPGHHRAAVHRRGRGGALGQRRRATGWRPACGPRTSAGRCG